MSNEVVPIPGDTFILRTIAILPEAAHHIADAILRKK